MKRVAIIGAGLAGLFAARGLRERCELAVFDKSRGVGGRMATRYAGRWEFDHGAQYFTARTAQFREFLAPLVRAGVVARWNPVLAELGRARVLSLRRWNEDDPHHVAAPRMNALGKSIASGLDLRTGVTIEGLEGRPGNWRLVDAKGAIHGPFDWVICAAPAPQTAALLADISELGRHAGTVAMQGCFALMLGFDTAPRLDWQAARVAEADIGWAAVNSSKPGRGAPFSLVVQSTNEWADAHIDDDLEGVREHLVREASEVLSIDLAQAPHCAVHRWRYASVGEQPDTAAQVDTHNHLAACGDWFVRGRVEAAFTSAARLLAQLDGAI